MHPTPFVGILVRTKLVLAGALLVLLAVPSAAAPAAADIVVTTISDGTNGDVATVAGLIATPGPDGVSLREAILATNNDPGSYTIGFALALRGTTITLAADLPPLTGGGVTIEGAGVTLSTTVESTWCECGLQIASSRNRLRGLTLERFRNGC